MLQLNVEIALNDLYGMEKKMKSPTNLDKQFFKL